MRFSGDIHGIWHNTKHGVMEAHTFAVEYTSDKLGKSLSIGNLQTGDMFQIPFDELYKIITSKGGNK